MATAAQLAQYCADHFPHKEPIHDFLGVNLEYFRLAFWAGVVALAWAVGRFGIPTLVSDIKNLITKLRTPAPSAQKTTTAVTTVSTTSSPAPVTVVPTV